MSAIEMSRIQDRRDHGWTCPTCRLSVAQLRDAEAAELAAVHDRVHHGGARTAQVLRTGAA